MSTYRQYYVVLEFGEHGHGRRVRNVVNISGSPPRTREELNVLVERAIGELGKWAERSILSPPDERFRAEIDGLLAERG